MAQPLIQTEDSAQQQTCRNATGRKEHDYDGFFQHRDSGSDHSSVNAAAHRHAPDRPLSVLQRLLYRRRSVGLASAREVTLRGERLLRAIGVRAMAARALPGRPPGAIAYSRADRSQTPSAAPSSSNSPTSHLCLGLGLISQSRWATLISASCA